MYLSSLLVRQRWHHVNQLLCVFLSLFSLACVLVIPSSRHMRGTVVHNASLDSRSRHSFSHRLVLLGTCACGTAVYSVPFVSRLSSLISRFPTLCPPTVPISFLVAPYLG